MRPRRSLLSSLALAGRIKMPSIVTRSTGWSGELSVEAIVTWDDGSVFKATARNRFRAIEEALYKSPHLEQFNDPSMPEGSYYLQINPIDVVITYRSHTETISRKFDRDGFDPSAAIKLMAERDIANIMATK